MKYHSGFARVAGFLPSAIIYGVFRREAREAGGGVGRKEGRHVRFK